MINQLSKFSPHLANKTQPLRTLLSSKNHWSWGNVQDKTFTELKESLISTEVLALYDPIDIVIENLPVTAGKLKKKIKSLQDEDPTYMPAIKEILLRRMAQFEETQRFYETILTL